MEWDYLTKSALLTIHPGGDNLEPMVETLEYLIEQAAAHPQRPRAGLYRELLRSQVYLLCVHERDEGGKPRDLSVWAEREAELGGVWVPVFPAHDDVQDFVRARRLRRLKGKQFLWMEHGPGETFRMLRGVHHFAGLRLHLDAQKLVPVPWSLVRALSEGRVPPDTPERYALPVPHVAIPAGERIALTPVDLGDGEGRLLSLPAAGSFDAEDARKLVRLDLGRHGVVWMACRHFLQVLRYLRGAGAADLGHARDVLVSLIAFEMYGEAEALCEWLASQGDEAFARARQAELLALLKGLDAPPGP